MGNSLRGQVDLKLDGQDYTLVFNNAVICELEQLFNDRPIDEIFFSGSVSKRAIREALRIGLKQKYRRLTAKQVSALIDATTDSDPLGGAYINRAVLLGIMGGNGASKQDMAQLEQLMDAAMADVAEADNARTIPTLRRNTSGSDDSSGDPTQGPKVGPIGSPVLPESD